MGCWNSVSFYLSYPLIHVASSYSERLHKETTAYLTNMDVTYRVLYQICFEGLGALPIHPAVAFYSPTTHVKLLRIQRLTARSGVDADASGVDADASGVVEEDLIAAITCMMSERSEFEV